MKIFNKILSISTVLTVLIFFLSTTETSALISRTDKLYFPLNNEAEAGFDTVYFFDKGLVFTPNLLLPLHPGVTFNFNCDVIRNFNPDETSLGDSGLNLNIMLPCSTEFFLNSVSFYLLLPTGPDSSENADFRYLSYGRDLLAVSYRAMMKFNDLYLYSGINYCMVSNSGPLNSGLYLNPASKKTWENAFGLNPFSRDAFVYRDNFSDDFSELFIIADYALTGTLVCGPVMKLVFNWNDQTSENTGYENASFLFGAEAVYFPSVKYGLKIQYIEYVNHDTDQFKRLFYLTFFSEI